MSAFASAESQPRAAVATRNAERHLSFVLGKETFAFDIAHVREVLQFESLTEVPLAPPFVRGVMNVRGAVVPVIDLSVRFARDYTSIGRRTCVVILEVPTQAQPVVLGVLVDQVNAVLDIEPGRVEPAPSFGSSVRSDFVRGVARDGQRFIILLDVRNVLSVDELASLSERATDA